MSQDYSQFTELMSYYYFSFNVYYVLIVILALNTLKVAVSFYKNSNNSEGVSAYDLLISTLVGFALANALYFQGVLSDISEVESDKWLGKMFVICLVAVILFIGQVIFSLLIHKKH